MRGSDKTTPYETDRTTLTRLFRSGLLAVKGSTAVEKRLEHSEIETPTKVIAVGKAAVSMYEGLPEAWQAFTPSLIITKTGHIGTAQFGRNVEALETSHPIPDGSSLNAGETLLAFVQDCAPGDRLLLLVSGGASALVEHLQTGCSDDDLFRLTNEALSSGANIIEINEKRKGISAIKGGKLLSHFKGSCVDVLAISDVCGDTMDVIGSGIGAEPQNRSFEYGAHIVASNLVAREAIVEHAASIGLRIVANAETMYDDVRDVADRIASDVENGPSGIYIYGGEPTVVLPKKPGRGGRNQALALQLAKCIRNRRDITGLVAGTDGTDGPTDAAGAYLDGGTFDACSGAEDALNSANSADFLARAGDQIITGPTGTNVMDIAIILKHP
ncbi:MAG: DUF4147 domain-containing protein [Pseudomonadota bacterium]